MLLYMWPKTTKYDEINNIPHTDCIPNGRNYHRPRLVLNRLIWSEVLSSIDTLVSSLFSFNEHSRWCHGLADNIDCEWSLIKVTIFYHQAVQKLRMLLLIIDIDCLREVFLYLLYRIPNIIPWTGQAYLNTGNIFVFCINSKSNTSTFHFKFYVC